MRFSKSLLLGLAITGLAAIHAPVAGASPFEKVFTVRGPANFIGGSNASGSAEAFCPPGTQMIGGGGLWEPRGNRMNGLYTVRSAPLPNNHWAVTGRNSSGEGRSFYATAQCGTPKPGGGFASTFVVESGGNFIGNNANGSVEPTCPPNSQMLSGGGYWSDLQRNGLIFPISAPRAPAGFDSNTWELRGRNFSGSGATIRGAVLCGVPRASGGFKIVVGVESRTVRPFDLAFIDPVCPPGAQLIGGGLSMGERASNGLGIAEMGPEGGTVWRSSAANITDSEVGFAATLRCGT